MRGDRALLNSFLCAQRVGQRASFLVSLFVEGRDHVQALLSFHVALLSARVFRPTVAGCTICASTGGTMGRSVAQFIGLCSSLQWSSHRTKSPCLALPATAGSH